MLQVVQYYVNGAYSGDDYLEYDSCGNIQRFEDGEGYCKWYSYDGLNRLTQEENQFFGKDYEYVYDTDGNITEVYERPTGENEWTVKKTYNYNGYNQLLSITTTNLSTNATSTQTIATAYNAMGNPTTYKGKTVTWKRGRVLTQYGTATYRYNGNNLRTYQKTDNKEYIYRRAADGKLLGGEIYDCAEYMYSGEYGIFYEGDRAIGMIFNRTKYLFQYDAEGNVSKVYDESGTLQAQYVYDAWGNHKVLDASGNAITDTWHIGHLNPFRYKGYYYDGETGLYYLESRYYDPETRRFINADNVSYLDPETFGGLNLYAYCNNNPVMFVDPTGCLPQWAMWLIGAVVIIGLAIATVATGGAAGGVAGFILAGAFKGAVIGAVSGAVVNGVIGGVSSAIGGGEFWSGFAEEAARGFMSGAIIGGITGAINSGIQVARSASYWNKGTFSSGYKSMKYHYREQVIKQGLTKGNTIVKYTKDALSFANNNGMNFTLNLSRNGLQNSWSLGRAFGNGMNGLYTSSGKIITFHYFYRW